MKGKVDERWNRRDVKRVRNGGKQGRLAIKKEKKKRNTLNKRKGELMKTNVQKQVETA